MLWLLLACANPLPESDRGPTAITVPTVGHTHARGVLLTVEPIMSIARAPERFTVPPGADLDPLFDAPWTLPPRQHLLDGLCWGNEPIRDLVLRSLSTITDVDAAAPDWRALAPTCSHPEYCAWVTETVTDPTLSGHLLEAALSRCGDAARTVFEGEQPVYVATLLDWYSARAQLGAGEAEPLLFRTIQAANPATPPERLAEVLMGWDHPEAAAALIALHRVADDPDSIALRMGRQSDPRAQELANEACSRAIGAPKCTRAWRKPSADWAITLGSRLFTPEAILSAYGASQALEEGLATCTLQHRWDDSHLAGHCLQVLSRLNRARAARVVSEAVQHEDVAELPGPLGTLARELDIDLKQLRKRISHTLLLQPDPRQRVGGSLDLLRAGGSAIDLGIERLETSVRRLLWLAGLIDLPVTTVMGPPAAPMAVHVWVDGHRYRIVAPPDLDAPASAELAVGLANRILEDRGDPRRYGLVDNRDATAVLAEPHNQVLLHDMTGLRWRNYDASTWVPEPPTDTDQAP